MYCVFIKLVSTCLLHNLGLRKKLRRVRTYTRWADVFGAVLLQGNSDQLYKYAYVFLTGGWPIPTKTTLLAFSGPL